MDSETPSYQPLNYIIASTLMVIIATQRMETHAWMMFLVASSKTKKEKVIAMAIPETADCTKAASDGIQAQTNPHVWCID